MSLLLFYDILLLLWVVGFDADCSFIHVSIGCDRIILINSKRFVFCVLSQLRASIDLKLFHLSAQLVKEGWLQCSYAAT